MLMSLCFCGYASLPQWEEKCVEHCIQEEKYHQNKGCGHWKKHPIVDHYCLKAFSDALTSQCEIVCEDMKKKGHSTHQGYKSKAETYCKFVQEEDDPHVSVRLILAIPMSHFSLSRHIIRV